MMEAMLAGSVPIVADLYGPAEIVTEDCGWKIPATNHTSMARLIAERLEWCFFNRHLLPSMGKKSASRIANHFTEDIFRARTKECYELAFSKRH
jgi:glycosyltransferase involved in cell wall biosynthesis